MMFETASSTARITLFISVRGRALRVAHSDTKSRTSERFLVSLVKRRSRWKLGGTRLSLFDHEREHRAVVVLLGVALVLVELRHDDVHDLVGIAVRDLLHEL